MKYTAILTKDYKAVRAPVAIETEAVIGRRRYVISKAKEAFGWQNRKTETLHHGNELEIFYSFNSDEAILIRRDK